MDPLISLLAVEAAGAVDAETMVKGVVPIRSLLFPLGIFVVGAF